MKLVIDNLIYFDHNYHSKVIEVFQEAKTEEESEWIDLIVDKNYEIKNYYPYQIRKKSNKREISVFKQGQYLGLKLSKRNYLKHIVIATQFISNPKHLNLVDHINKIPNDFHVSNLRWVNFSENNRNAKNRNGYYYEYFESLPENSIKVTNYNNYKFENLYRKDKTFYYFNGVYYRKLITLTRKNIKFVNAFDVNNKLIKINLNKFFNV